jgi:hypothetical protein
MRPISSAFELANQKLTQACQSYASACCKQGFIFLLPEEIRDIELWLANHAPDQMAAFHARLRSHDDFALLDQGDACIFLNESNLCRLHSSGIKPKECYLWPLYIYVDQLGTLDVRVFSTCCAGHNYLTSDHPSVDAATQFAAQIGYERTLRFREAYNGGKIYHDRILRELDLNPQHVRPLRADELDRYRAIYEGASSSEDWNATILRTARMIAVWPYGIHIYEQDGRVLGYMSLWPITRQTATHIASGQLLCTDIDEEALERHNPGNATHWVMTAIAIMERDQPLRSVVTGSLLCTLKKRIQADHETTVFARAATAEGGSFLRRAGFRFDCPDVPELARLIMESPVSPECKVVPCCDNTRSLHKGNMS